jgi:hypothetical protein
MVQYDLNHSFAGRWVRTTFAESSDQPSASLLSDSNRAHLGFRELLRKLDEDVRDGSIHSTSEPFDQRAQIDILVTLGDATAGDHPLLAELGGVPAFEHVRGRTKAENLKSFAE